jgi:hypothetical protein
MDHNRLEGEADDGRKAILNAAARSFRKLLRWPTALLR